MRFDGGAITALAGVSLGIDRGEFVAVTGPSGCGKSTLLNLIGMLEVPTSGELFFESSRYSSVDDPSLFRRTNFGFVFQSFHLIATLSALENVLVPTIGCPGPTRAHTRRARELLGRLGLQSRLDHFPSTLSGGERQRVAMARALINDPLVVLADEPTGSLDSASAGEVLDLLTGLREERGLTLVIVTHDPDVSRRADRVVAMRDGRVLVAEADAS